VSPSGGIIRPAGQDSKRFPESDEDASGQARPLLDGAGISGIAGHSITASGAWKYWAATESLFNVKHQQLSQVMTRIHTGEMIME